MVHRSDISACFDEVDHRVLESILRERINDERFIRLINKLLKAGYLDTEHQFYKNPILSNLFRYTTNKGVTFPRRMASPILFNIH